MPQIPGLRSPRSQTPSPKAHKCRNHRTTFARAHTRDRITLCLTALEPLLRRATQFPHAFRAPASAAAGHDAVLSADCLGSRCPECALRDGAVTGVEDFGLEKGARPGEWRRGSSMGWWCAWIRGCRVTLG